MIAMKQRRWKGFPTEKSLHRSWRSDPVDGMGSVGQLGFEADLSDTVLDTFFSAISPRVISHT